MEKNELWPNFLIVGAAKAGTTSLYHYLKGHPEVFLPDVKEPHFFSELGDAYSDETAYLNLFKDKGDAARWGESSVTYIVDPTACERIYETCGQDVRLIFLLRNPAKAMYSGYGQVVKMHRERRPPEEALLKSFSITEWHVEQWPEHYYLRVRYAEHLKRFLKKFPASSIKVYIFEEFFQEGLPLYGDLCRFLGISEKHSPTEAVFNKGEVWKSYALNSFIWKYYGKYLSPVVRRLLPQSARTRLRKGLEDWNKTPLEPVDPALHRELQRRLSDDVRDLEKLLGRDLSSLWF